MAKIRRTTAASRDPNLNGGKETPMPPVPAPHVPIQAPPMAARAKSPGVLGQPKQNARDVGPNRRPPGDYSSHPIIHDVTKAPPRLNGGTTSGAPKPIARRRVQPR